MEAFLFFYSLHVIKKKLKINDLINSHIFILLYFVKKTIIHNKNIKCKKKKNRNITRKI